MRLRLARLDCAIASVYRKKLFSGRYAQLAGEAYGPIQNDANTFSCIFEGIEYDLDGAYIWCGIEDGHYSVTSQKARISVGNENSPPMILEIPAAKPAEEESEGGIPWWFLVLVGLAGIGAGIGAAVILIRKNNNTKR